MAENKTPNQRREAERINGINEQQERNRAIKFTTETGAENTDVPFTKAYDELNSFLDDELNHPVGFLFKGIAENVEELQEIMPDLKLKNPKVARKVTEGALLVSTLLFSACSAKQPIKDPEKSSENQSIEEVDPTLGQSEEEREEVSGVLETEKVDPSYTSTFEQTSTPQKTNTPEATIAPTRIPMNEDYVDRGFVIGEGTYELDGMETNCTSLRILESKIDEYFVQEDKIILSVRLNMYGIEKEEEIVVGSFHFAEFNNETQEFSEMQYINTDSDLENILGKDGKYRMFLIVKDHQSFDEKLINDYINGDIDLEFDITDILYYGE